MKAWVGALRPRTLPLAWATIVLGTLLAADRGYFDGLLLGLTPGDGHGLSNFVKSSQ